MNAEVGHGWGPFLTSEAMRTHLSADVFAAVKPQDTSIPFAPSNPDASIEARWFEIGSLHALRNLHPRAAAILLSDPGGTPWEQWEQHALLKSHPLPEHGSGGGARGGGGATGGGGSSTTDGASGVKVESGGGATAGGAAGGGGATSGGGGAGAAGAFGEEVLLRAAPKRRRGSGWGSGAGAEVRAGPHFLQQAHFLHVEIEALEFHFLHALHPSHPALHTLHSSPCTALCTTLCTPCMHCTLHSSLHSALHTTLHTALHSALHSAHPALKLHS